MADCFTTRFEGIHKTFQFINLPEDSLLEKGWEDINRSICADEALMSWLSRLNGPDCRTFDTIYVMDPVRGIFQDDLSAYMTAFDDLAETYLNIYQRKGARAGAGMIWQNRKTAPILGVQSDNVILIDYEKIMEVNQDIGATAVICTVLHECTHLIETYVADGDCLLGRMTEELAATCARELFFDPQELFARCPTLGPAVRHYVEYCASYQQAEGQQREILTSAVELLAAAALDMKDIAGGEGLKNAEDLLGSHLERGLSMMQSQMLMNTAVRRSGIDVSYWNGHLTKGDFEKMKQQGVSFVIARAGGYVGTMSDSTFENNYRQARAAGLDFGAYYYGSAVTAEQAKQEARHAVKLCKGKHMAFPIWYDVEDPGTMGKLSKEKLNQVIKAFCDTVKAEGGKVGVYASYSWLTSKIGDLKGCAIWVAQYNATCSYHKPKALWQYSSNTTFHGVKGRFDISIEY